VGIWHLVPAAGLEILNETGRGQAEKTSRKDSANHDILHKNAPF
jgi:hypothetical protein